VLKRRSPQLTAAMAAKIKLMASMHPDLAQHQIAAELDINQGRVSEVLTGKQFPEVQPSAQSRQDAA